MLDGNFTRIEQTMAVPRKDAEKRCAERVSAGLRESGFFG